MTNPLNDIRILNAGDARGLNRSDLRPSITSADLSGDLNASAGMLGVSVRDLIAMRRRAGIAPSHRGPSLFARLAARLTRKG